METIKLWNSFESANTGKSSDDFEPYLETYLLDKTQPLRGAVIVCPGGGYAGRAEHEGAPVAQKFNEFGFHAFVLHYRVLPYRFPAAQRDLFRAVRLVRSRADQWGIDASQIAVLGFSAGGHLVASGGTLFNEVDAKAGDAADAYSQRPDAILPCYAVISLQDDFGHVGSGENLLGTAYEQKKEYYSLQNRVTVDTPPCFLWHTVSDEVVPVRNSVVFAEKCWENNIPAELHIFPDGPHGTGLAPAYSDLKSWSTLAAKFLTTTCKFTAR
ncbi:MAG: alpha/beta hydrolase [Victivallales bacterium]|jgi:acetyl esterase/lipase|nr:alpha/beta hydrolase [Victivallales bacterium]